MVTPETPTVAPRGARTQRLFFALWPDDGVRAAIGDWTRRHVPGDAGRAQRPDQLHLTLAFLGSVPVERFPDARAAGDATAGTAVTVVFDRVEHWRKPRLLCLAASETPPALDVLVASLRTAISARQLPFDERPYRPHITLARHVARFDPAATNEPLRWHADSFALVESRTDPSGVRYVPLASWLLDPSPGAA